MLQNFLVGSARGVANAGARSINLKVTLDWNVHECVLRLAEDAAFGFRHANHRERPAFDLELLAHRIGIRKQVALQIRADYSDHGMVPVFDVSKVAAIGNLGIAERGPVVGAPVQIDIAERLRTERNGDRAPGAHSEIVHQRGVIS